VAVWPDSSHRLAPRFPAHCLISICRPIQYSKDDVFDPMAGTFEDYEFETTNMEKTALAWLRRFRAPSVHDDIMELQK
jgi:hypothetical protein